MFVEKSLALESRTSRVFAQNCNIFSVSSMFQKYNPGKTNSKFVTS